MYPYIIQTNSFTLGSYGLMLAIAYLVGRALFLNRIQKNFSQSLNTELYIIGLLVFGVLGAKLLFILKNPDRVDSSDLINLFSSTGFSSQGALIAALIVTFVFATINKISFAKLLDSASVPAIAAYAIARVGCFLAGDDCFGKQTDLIWGMAFSQGIEPTYHPVHPVPLYEFIYSIGILKILNVIETKSTPPYSVFFSLLGLWGLCRFLVEFVSSNPVKLWGMTGSQLGACLMLIAALIYFFKQGLPSINNRQKKAG
ncbi:prolipoprotein diacylglyceryl transferase [Aliikangiella sp. IMCC44653]